VARAARRSRLKFGPAWLGAHLKALLPQFPDIAACVAFSGGADSTALLAALARLKRAGLSVRAVHVDHHLQPHSARWREHCQRVARALGVALEVRHVRVARGRGDSLEAAARTARYAALARALKAGELLFSAHHEDDQLETVLLQLLRGAGVAGLAAMPATVPFARTVLVRPLLQVPGAELRAWVRTQGLSFVEDESNQDERFDRNYLRARVLPLLRARWPAAATTVARSARHAAEAQELLDTLGREDCAQAAVGAALSAKVLRRLSVARRRNALRYWITASGHLAPPAKRLEEIAVPLLAARADTHPWVGWSGVRVAREADLLWLRAQEGHHGRARPASLTWGWQRHSSCALPAGGTLTLRRDARGPVDLDALTPLLTLRERRGGERLRPLAGGARRSLKGLLQEARVPVEERARLPLIYSGATLVAVADLFLDASVQASAATRRRGRLSWRATH
jgi:tRNA(Ile)-lysidine synthase